MANHYLKGRSSKIHARLYDLFLGTSSYYWRKRHNLGHHVYTNIECKGNNLDTDTNSFMGIRRYGRRENANTWTSIKTVLTFLYMGALIIPMFILLDFIVYTTKQFGISGVHKVKRPCNFEKVWFWLGKALFFILFWLVPSLYFGAQWIVIMIAVFSLMGIIFLSHFEIAHCSYEPKYLRLSTNHTEYSWQTVQIMTSANYATKSFWMTYFTAGLNYQIEHHLFPCHDFSEYPRISNEIKQIAAENNVPYIEFLSWRQGVFSVLKNALTNQKQKEILL